MRWRGVHHVEISVVDYDASIAFYDRMFGWLGYKSFWTLDIGYRSTYYTPNMILPHSYIGIQPAKTGTKLDHRARATGIHHVAIWAKSRREIDLFHKEFLMKNDVNVTEPPAEYLVYAPGYYGVFFDDPVSGIHWEVAHIPLIPSPASFWRWKRAMNDGIAESVL
jgi:catechol 2,3-dioxygenase-like lactoylglutathione lyase family enzyme